MKKINLRKLSYKVLDWIGGGLFFVIIGLTAVNAVTFWLWGKKYPQLDEIVMASFVWVSFISLGHHYRDKSAISVDFILERFTGKTRKCLEIFNDVASFVIGAAILYFAWLLMVNSVNKYTAILKLRFCYIDLGIVIGFFSLLVNIICKYLPGGEETEKETEKEGVAE